MSEKLNFDYYHGKESEQFTFFRIPKLLVKDKRFKCLSSDAKMPYGLMLDRKGLSMKNGWLDEENRAYIVYAVDKIMEDLGCSKPTCIKIIRELDSETGIGLIEKKRRGLGKPDVIYVKNFASEGEEPSGVSTGSDSDGLIAGSNTVTPASAECQIPEPCGKDDMPEASLSCRGKESLLQEVKNLDFLKSNNFACAGKETLLAEVKDLDPNNTNMSHRDRNDTDNSDTDCNNMIQASKGQTMQARLQLDELL